MAERRIRRALIAVYDKAGIVEFARALVREFGIEVISTGGTARHLHEAGIPVTLVEQVTGFPEMLDGRVKTLHPKIHAAILADRDNPEHMRQLAERGIEPIDMVVVNLYPFEATVADPKCRYNDAIEMIDIGGPCLLRSAAKNHKHVLVVSSKMSYEQVLSGLRNHFDGRTWDDLCQAGALFAFDATASYDGAVATWLNANGNAGVPLVRYLRLWNARRLRYGENPQQSAELFSLSGPHDASDLPAASTLPEGGRAAGKELSYNNYVDADAALGLCAELTRTDEKGPATEKPRPSGRSSSGRACAVFVKHTNPCGVGVADDPVEAYRHAYLGDPNAAMGGILAVNFDVTAPVAEAVMESLQHWGKGAGAGAFFLEAWIAPGFQDEAVQVIRERKKWGTDVRLLVVSDVNGPSGPLEHVYRSIAGGMLIQTADQVGLNEGEWKTVTKRAPDEREMADLRRAWLIAKHTKSNAISIVRDGMLIGNGAGQMSRVMSCRVATWLAQENGHAERLAGAAAASDAFFPFRDGPDLLIDAGVTALIQPGGSKRDAEVIAACDGRGAAMVFTGTRHFRH